MPQISVIIPTFNRAIFLKETLESVLAQTYTNYEVIVIDDGSTDNTEEIVSAFLHNHTQIRYIKQANAGVSAARNHGIFEARGEWIAFLDSDDLWFPDILEKWMKFLAERPTAGAVCSPQYALQDGAVVKDKNGENLLPWGRRKTSVMPFDLFATAYYVSTSSVLVRKKVLYKAGLFEVGLKIGEDYSLWVKVAKFSEFWTFDEISGYYRLHPTNVSMQDDDEFDFYCILCRKLQVVRWSAEPQISQLFENGIGSAFCDRASRYRDEQNYKKVARYYWKAARYSSGFKRKARLLTMSFIAKFFPFVYRMRDQVRKPQ